MDVLISLLVLVIVLAIALYIVRLMVGDDPKLLKIAYLIVGGIALIYLLGILFGNFPLVPYPRR